MLFAHYSYQISQLKCSGLLSIPYVVSRLVLVILQVFAYLGSSISSYVPNHED